MLPVAVMMEAVSEGGRWGYCCRWWWWLSWWWREGSLWCGLEPIDERVPFLEMISEPLLAQDTRLGAWASSLEVDTTQRFVCGSAFTAQTHQCLYQCAELVSELTDS